MVQRGKIIRNGIVYSGSGGSVSNVVYLTQEEYDALPDSKLTDYVEYRITNAGTHINAARDWTYDNSESGLEATTVQDAIDEMNSKIGSGNGDLGEDENGMTIHEKLDFLMRGGIIDSPELVLVSTETSFNISDIVGAGNVGKYSVNDFVIVPNMENAFTTSNKWYPNPWGTNAAGILPTISFTNFILSYDNTNGDVNITPMKMSLGMKYYTEVAAGDTYIGSSSGSFTISPKVYLLVKTDNELSEQ